MKKFIYYLNQEVKKHLFDYLTLITGGIFFLIFLRSLHYNRLSILVVTLFFSSFYILWGIYHHSVNNTLHLKNVVEYILIGFLILFIIIVLLF